MSSIDNLMELVKLAILIKGGKLVVVQVYTGKYTKFILAIGYLKKCK